MSLGSFVSSVFARPGQNAANDQAKNNQGIQSYGSGLINNPGGFGSLLTQQAGYANGLEGQRESTINNLANSYSDPRIAQQAAARQKNSIFGNASRANSQLLGLGGSPGLQHGLQQQNLNSAVGQANQVDLHYQSPEYHQQQLMNLLQTLQGGQQTPALQGVQGAASLAYGAPQVQVGQGLGDILGGLAGQAIGGASFGGLGGHNQPAAPYQQQYGNWNVQQPTDWSAIGNAGNPLGNQFQWNWAGMGQ